MPVFWKVGMFWVNINHVVAVREMKTRPDSPLKYKILLDNPLGELPSELNCDGDEARNLLQLLEASQQK